MFYFQSQKRIYSRKRSHWRKRSHLTLVVDHSRIMTRKMCVISRGNTRPSLFVDRDNFASREHQHRKSLIIPRAGLKAYFPVQKERPRPWTRLVLFLWCWTSLTTLQSDSGDDIPLIMSLNSQGKSKKEAEASVTVRILVLDIVPLWLLPDYYYWRSLSYGLCQIKTKRCKEKQRFQ